MKEYIASIDTAPGRSGRAVIYRGSQFIAECRDLGMAFRIAELLNSDDQGRKAKGE